MKTNLSVLLLVVSLLAACSSDSSGERENIAPILSDIASVNTTANAVSQPIDFRVFDENVSTLSFDVNSDRPEVVSNDAIQVVGSGSMRSLEITPVVDMTGDSMITIIATDAAGLAASTSFLLTVVPEQKSMSQFARDTFTATEDDEPALINAVEFDQDADDDDFADLLAQ